MQVAVGQQVRVVFAGRRRTGWVTGVGTTTDTATERILPLAGVDGAHRWFDEPDLRLYRWVADRYAGTLADVLRHALPRRVAAAEREPQPSPSAVAKPDGEVWDGYTPDALLGAVAGGAQPQPAFWLPPLPGADRTAMVRDLVARCLAGGRSALVLAPDPASPLPAAALHVAGAATADYRPDNPRARYRAFLRGRAGAARVAAGERSAVFAPLTDLGLVVVDDEANPAYKERRSPRHHVREVALARARMTGAVCVLLSDMPSANLWRLLTDGHVAAVTPDRMTRRRQSPRVDVVDLSDPNPTARRTRFADAAAGALTDVVRGAGAGVVLASRGGQGAALVCRSCRRRLSCPVCAGSLAVDRADERWRCPACQWRGAPFSCPDCGGQEFSPLAAGAGRLASELRRSHPDADVVRMEGFDAPGPQRRPGIGVMTRGSVVARPGWLRGRQADVVVVPDADALLRRPSYAAAEDALRLWMAVATWTSRLVLQTREPRHHAVQALVRWDPEGFWERETEWRTELGLPPAASLVAVRCPDAALAQTVAESLRATLAPTEVLGPDLDGELIVKTRDLRGTLAALTPLREDWARRDLKVRVDVDPLP